MLMHDKIALRRGIVSILVGLMLARLMAGLLQLDGGRGRGVDSAGVRGGVLLAAVRHGVLEELGMGDALGG